MKFIRVMGAGLALAVSATAASAITVEQCRELGGSVNLATAECLLTAAQQEEARALGYLPGGTAPAPVAALGGTIGAGGGGAGLGLILAIALIGESSSTTTSGS